MAPYPCSASRGPCRAIQSIWNSFRPCLCGGGRNSSINERHKITMTTCQALACTKTAGAFSPLCSTHRNRLRKQGHEGQRGITKSQLETSLKMVRDRRMKNPDSPVWPTLVTRWQRLGDDSRGVVNTYDAGLPMIIHKKLAADEVIRLTTMADPQRVIDTALAMFMLWEMTPRLFLSDRAFRTQLVRRVLRVSAANAVTYTGSDRPKKAYRDILPKTVEVLSQGLIEAFGATGVTLARLEKKEAQEMMDEKKLLEDGLEDMQ